MTPVERLIAAGIRPDCARETIMWFRAQGDDYGLEKYLNEVEARKGVPALIPVSRALPPVQM